MHHVLHCHPTIIQDIEVSSELALAKSQSIQILGIDIRGYPASSDVMRNIHDGNYDDCHVDDELAICVIESSCISLVKVNVPLLVVIGKTSLTSSSS